MSKSRSARRGNAPAQPQRPPRISESSLRTVEKPPVVRARTTRSGRSRRVQVPWWRTGKGTAGIGTGIVVVLLIFVLIARNQGSTSSALQPVPATILQQVTHVSPSVAAQVGTGGLSQPFTAANQATVLKDSSGKPLFVYIGAEYCPFCAAERWSVIVALSRFGTFSNLHLTTSSSTDTYPDTPTFTFYKSSYTSPYLAFQAVEMQDRTGGTLQQPTSLQSQLLNVYDAPPYFPAKSAGAIPFLDMGNQYLEAGSGYMPDVLTNSSWAQIAASLSDPKNPIAQSIVGDANYITAALCVVTNNQPANVCTTAPIPTIQAQLPKGHA